LVPLKQVSRLLNPLIKIIIFIGLGIVLYKQVFTNERVEDAFSTLFAEVEGRFPLLMIVVMLMFVNWGIETLKWKLLVSRLDEIGFWRAFQGVLFGVAFSLFTPNRLGEYAGRILVLKHNRIAAIVSSLIGSYSQIVFNMIIGGLAFILYLMMFKGVQSVTYIISMMGIFATVTAFLIISYFNIDIVSVLFNRYSLFRKIAHYVDVVKTYNAKDLKIILAFSAMRYATYCLQFHLLLKYLKTGLHISDALVLLPSTFFLQAILPTMAIFDISLRGEIAYQIISPYAPGGSIKVVAATVLLWLINLIIPAIMGGIAALTFRFFNAEDSSA
jgi:hypothetical protein